MMYNNMQNFVGIRNNASSFARRIVGTIFLLLFLVITILLYFLALPAWKVRLSGVQVTAVARVIGVCASDDSSSGDSYSFSYAFTDAQGKHYNIARDSFCTNVIGDGDHVAVWYMPNDPNNLVTTPEVILLYIMSGVGGGMDLVSLVVILVAVIGGFRARRRQESFNYANMGLR